MLNELYRQSYCCPLFFEAEESEIYLATSPSTDDLGVSELFLGEGVLVGDIFTVFSDSFSLSETTFSDSCVDGFLDDFPFLSLDSGAFFGAGSFLGFGFALDSFFFGSGSFSFSFSILSSSDSTFIFLTAFSGESTFIKYKILVIVIQF